ncbi:MAG TPA: Fe-S cluster assembly protein SufD [Prolixibacteraceae bacterium]|nr:Fe-S cluster assembly protein SufD [Prolixibacteraceae bacterium]HQE53125.1 Fe-S cluster assembly protein SufD [Prolixibacteraceae bacterium]HQH77098.1 Fe-S cluster assembly protein SufD [Prolixibacteraceae bacterium]HQJ85405.1 Fe-S cluster assembly protein SufD [Prolixibacteraceae bacterium]
MDQTGEWELMMNAITDAADLSLMYLARYREAADRWMKETPPVLHRNRETAIREFLRQGIPSKKNENYKYSPLQPYFSWEYDFQHSRNHVDFQLNEVFQCDIPQLDTVLMLVMNGWFHSLNSERYELPPGVIAGSLEEIAAAHPGVVEPWYGSLAEPAEDPLVALNSAFARDGFFIYVPRGVRVEKPIQVINLQEAEHDTFVTQRNLVIVDPGAEVNLIICDHTLNANRYMVNDVTEIFVGKNARVDVCSVQNQHNRAASVHSVFFRQERDSRITSHAVTLHGGMVRNNLKALLNGENCEANLYGMAFIDRKQHVDNSLQVIHAFPNCQSNQHYKNVLDDESSGAFSGRIHVLRDAQKTNAYQRNNSLLLTDKALMQTKPQLIIEADDVKCSHGATVGQIDENALFYLRSRGIEESRARLMLMNAFSYEVVQQISADPLRDRISELVDKRLRGDVARCHECAYRCDC